MTNDKILQYNIEHIKKSIPSIEKKAGASKEDLALFLNRSINSIERSIRLKKKDIPKFISENERGHIFFPLINIAIFLSDLRD